MRKLLLLLIALLTGVSGAWADSKISKAVAGTYLFDSNNPALTVNKGGTATITNTSGTIVIHHNNLSEVKNSARTYAAVVMKVDMPTTAPASFSNFINLTRSSDDSGSIGLGVTTAGKLKGTWGGSEWSPSDGGVETASAVTGEHTIVLLCNDNGTTIYVDDDNTSANKLGLRCSTPWTDLRIESAYASCVKSVYVFSGEQKDNISAFFSELSNVVTVANSETKSVSENSTATRFFVASGGTLTADVDYDADKIEVAGTIEIVSEKTLTVNVAGFDLTKITGEGNVTLDADATISGSKLTVATGKLIINEGKTLTLGTGQGQTNSIASFTSIELSGTIKHNNSVATLNNVTVPENKTGKIFAYDMGSTSDGFKLAGTTTLNGNLTVCNKYNFQMKVDNLAGSGTWLICGTTGNAFNAEGTASNEKAIINVAAATTFTGTINLNNVPTDSHPSTNTSQVTVQGNLVGCTLKKTTGDYFYYSGASLDGTTLDGVILSGTARITTSNTVNIKNLAGNNLNNTDHLYAFVGGGTINFYGVCDLTKKSDGTDCNSANIGYGSSANVIIKAGANVTAGVVLNSSTISSNAPITVDETATLTAVGSTHTDNATLLIYSTNLSNNGTVNLNVDGRKSIVSALSGSGTLNVASGSSISAPSVPNTMTLTGAGDVVLTSFPSTTAPTLSAWTGAVEFPNGGGSSTNLEEIFNAWGNTNSTIKLNNVTGGYLGNGGTVNPTLNILSGKTLILNNGHSNSNATLTKVTGAGTLDRRGWSGSKNHNLIITTLTGFTGTLSGTGHPIIVQKLVLATEPAGDALLIKTSGNVTLNTEDPDGLYVGLQRTSAYSWETKTVDEVEGIYVSAFDQVQRYREMATAVVTPYFSYIGTGVGKYTISLGANEYTTIDAFTDAIDAWTETSDYVVPTIAINQPTSAFYRFYIGDKYMCNVADGSNVRSVTTTNNDASTIFYLAPGATYNYLVAYADGYGFNYGYCKAVSPGIFNSYTFPESATIGKYCILSDKGTEDNIYSNRYITVNGSSLVEGQGAWTIEKVTSLPVTIGDAHYATFSAPVAVTVPEGVTAYKATSTGEDVMYLAPINSGNVIPANMGVILYAETSDTYNFAITEEEGSGTSILTGTTAAISWASGYYTLQKATSGDGVGLYGNAPTNSSSIIPIIPGFKAYYNSNSPSGVKGYRFNFGDENGVKTLEEIQGAIDNNEIFDMSGRRIAKAARGLYIVNGKKLLVK